MGRRALLTAALVLATGACGGDPRSPRDREADAAWDALRASPSDHAWESFRRANVLAAREHGGAMDARGVTYRLREYEAQADAAARHTDRDEALRLAFQVIDEIDGIESRDQFRIYEDAVPGAIERLRRIRAAADEVTRR